jgi:hypothetical protein
MALFKKKPEFGNISQVKSSVARGIRCEWLSAVWLDGEAEA